jgi:hypothetical protein
VFRAKFMNRAARLPLSLALTIAAASCGDLQLASSAIAAPAPAPAPGPPPAPSSPEERLRQLDQLHADLELAKMRAAIRKANNEGLETPGSALGPGGAPPMPQLGPNSAMMNLPPIVPPGLDAGKGKGKKEKAAAPETPSFTLVEAWGAGAERQAILHSESGDRIVRVGDQIPAGVITAISGGAVTYRDEHGRAHTID